MPRAQRNRLLQRPPLWAIYGLLLLPVGLLVCFGYVPAVSALWHAFTRWDPGLPAKWVGLANFAEMITDPVFLKSCVNLAKLGSFVFVAHLTMPFIVAELIYHLSSERVSYAARVAVVTPMIIPGVVIFMLWRYLYSDAGIVTEFLRTVGLQSWVHAWLSDPDTALWACACVGFPFAMGVPVLIFYAGLNNIPATVLEAADLDGLGNMGKIFRIHVPLVLQQIKLVVILTVITVVNGFESIFLLTQDGGPGYETMVPGLYMYFNGFTYKRMGYACAIGLTMLAGLLLFTITLNRALRGYDYEPGKS
jgi:raffinose/stachyose/melibiose transport system permease protein